jgi:ectoine hydroxylase-related dioxygenase (phytanoyl-CoA dioxygenase family)
MLTLERPIEQPLSSNGYNLETTPDRLGWLMPSDPHAPIARLREQYAEQGYLWLRGILNRAEVLAFRRRYFAAFEHTGLLAPGSDPQDGIFSGADYDKEAAHKILVEAVRWAAYEAFCLSRPIIEFYEAFLDAPVYLHKRKLIRYTRPGEVSATGAHYDQIYLRDGTDQFCSSWLPIGDVPVEMGGLLYLEGSHSLGQQLEAQRMARMAGRSPDERISAYVNARENGWLGQDLAGLAQQTGKRWLVGDFAAGDMLVHSPYLIHAATTNEDKLGRMRLSTDIRYQRVSDPVDRRWGNHWSPDDNL